MKMSVPFLIAKPGRTKEGQADHRHLVGRGQNTAKYSEIHKADICLRN
jgi:hypothetical protein